MMLDGFRAIFHKAHFSESDEKTRFISPVLSLCSQASSFLKLSSFRMLDELCTRGDVYNMCCYIMADEGHVSWHI